MLILLVGRLGLEPRTKALKGLSSNRKRLILLAATWVRQLQNGLFLPLQRTEVATGISRRRAPAIATHFSLCGQELQSRVAQLRRSIRVLPIAPTDGAS